MRYTFTVEERLKKEQHINTLFRHGKAFSVFPVKFIYIIGDSDHADAAPVLTGFSVPKKKFKSSVHRHRIRRLMVESWRLNKHEIYNLVPPGKQVHLFLIFTDKVLPEYATVLQAVQQGIHKLGKLVVS